MSPARLLGARPVGREHLGSVTYRLDMLEAAIARAVNEGDLLLAARLRGEWTDLWNEAVGRRDA
jgi:hypothetical protein